MAKHNREYFTCDVCGAELDRPYHGGERGTYKITMEMDFAVAGQTVRWDHTCQSCNDLLGRMIDDMVEMAKGLRQARKETKA